MLSTAFALVVMALATAAAALTLTKSSITAPLRKYITPRMPWLGKLLSCAYCASHWIAAALVGLGGWVTVSGWPVIDFVVTTFAIVAVAAIINGAMGKLLLFHETEARLLREEVIRLHASLSDIDKYLADLIANKETPE